MKFIISITILHIITSFELIDVLKPDLFIDEICSFNQIQDPIITYNKTTNQIQDIKCICSPEYDTLNTTDIRKINQIPIQCNYRKRRRYVTLFFSFFLPFGIDHFYLGNYFIFMGILLACIITIFGNCYRFAVTTNQDYLKDNTNLFFLVIGFLIIIGWIVNIILVILGVYTDGNNIEMADDLEMLFFAQKYHNS
jgi:hypothetical protein